jgi:integrase
MGIQSAPITLTELTDRPKGGTMPKQKRHKTKYPGVYYTIGTKAKTKKPERIYYYYFRKNGRIVEEKAGRQSKDDMTAARANQIRARKIDGELMTNAERRAAQEATKKAEAERWTVDKLAGAYFENRTDSKGKKSDQSRYDKYLKDPFGAKEPRELAPLDVDRLRIGLSKKLAPQTIKHILNLLTWIVNYGCKNRFCAALPFHVQKPVVNNEVTENLSPDELKRLLKAIDAEPDIQIANFMRMALYTGMRRGELLKLKWEHVDFERGFITLVDPKGKINQTIPMNDAARGVLEANPRTKDTPYVFPGRGGKQRVTVQVASNRVKKAAGLPKDFRPLHGLRHAYASMLASSGKVDLYTLQKLLTHKSPAMTQRYAHLTDHALQKAATVAADIIGEANTEPDEEKVVNLKP